MRITIEDLEALKELNDELEENHVETEKALQEDIGQFKCPLCSCDDLTTLAANRCERHTDPRHDTENSEP